MVVPDAQYPDALNNSVPDFILEALVNKYGERNVISPQVISRLDTNRIIAYAFERSEKTSFNSPDDLRPESHGGIQQFFVDYVSDPRVINSQVDPSLLSMISPEFNSVDDFMRSHAQSNFSAADIDVVWFNGEFWRGLEITGWYMPFEDRTRTEELVSTFNRRATWRGTNGPIALYKEIEAAEDLNIRLGILCLNTIGNNTGIYREDGNGYLFRLTNDQIGLLQRGQSPRDARFLTVSRILELL